ncbi:hypothetical protein AB0O28_22395 [Microbispora sp. NPDC088329]|uniref:hypothetical protein n=1 Tax=Microbispora sp. NPDC088329 TaxID=3154869 RepID=UPI00344AB7B7
MSRPHSALRVASAVELGSLAVLLANLATVHLAPVSSLAGPLHGCAYLVVVVAAARDGDLTGKVLAWLPGIGGLLVLRRLARTPREKAASDMPG